MADECINYCNLPVAFPRRPNNRPALPHIGYRIGQYADIREAIFRGIDLAMPLRGWTHRAPDDPAVALLEGAAIIGDILTFYQEHYANEAFLRTARWKESVGDLLRLLGYRPAPGLAGLATFAFEAKGTKPIEIPAGLPVKAELEGQETPAEFQTEEALTAYPHLSKFHLYKPRIYLSALASKTDQAELSTVAASSALADLAEPELKAGDKLLLMPADNMWSVDGASYSAQGVHQIVKLKSVRHVLGRTILKFEDPVDAAWSTPVRAFRINRTFYHFGHNAPPTFTVTVSSGGKITGSSERNTSFLRHSDDDHQCTQHSVAYQGSTLRLTANTLPLDVEAEISPGSVLAIEAKVKFDGMPGGVPQRMLVSRRVASVESLALQCGSLTGRSTYVRFSTNLIVNQSKLTNSGFDIRDVRVFEVTSRELKLRTIPKDSAGPVPSATNALFFYGTPDEARTLAGRPLLAKHEDGRTIELVCTNTPEDFGASGEPRANRLTLDRKPTPFRLEDFNEETPLVTVYGNLAPATQGKAEPDAVLGNGDSRLTYQTFKIPKKPLTYLFSAGATPPAVPELDVYVSGRKWTRVPSLYGSGPKDEVYVVREDAEGTSFVQFGDGETGARLPSGLKNVVAKYRSGIGAFGPPKSNASPSTSQKVDGLGKIFLLTNATGGSEPEDPSISRIAGPGKVQSLGRLVSLADYETELLTISGITAAIARWGLHKNIPSVLLTVILDAGRESEFTAVRQNIEHARQCRGPSGYPVIVKQAKLRYVFLDLEYAADPALIASDVEVSIRAALALVGDKAAERSGLFGLHVRRIGEDEYATRIEGVVQQVPGVLWCRVVALGMFGASVVDPLATPLPSAPRTYQAKLNCSNTRLLQLHPNHLTLTSVLMPPEACA